MTTTVNIYEAKTNLSHLIRLVESGQEVIIKRFNTEVARLSAPEVKVHKYNFGVYENDPNFWISPDFDDEDPEILKMFGIID
jgi:antitoxin (DNA-binding transcriptional repressor) of toxin-antitoxin stability system